MSVDLKTKEYTTSLRVCNTRSIALTFILEPWGEEYTIAPEATFEIVARGPEGDSLEVEYADDHVTLYGWPGSVVSLFHEGTELGTGSSERTPIPFAPHLEEEKKSGVSS
jgi:hypothetical protein